MVVKEIYLSKYPTHVYKRNKIADKRRGGGAPWAHWDSSSECKQLAIYFPGYKIARRDRSDGRKGGGTLIYFAEDLNAYKRRDLSDQLQIEAA